jgi:hypothetical protein
MQPFTRYIKTPKYVTFCFSHTVAPKLYSLLRKEMDAGDCADTQFPFVRTQILSQALQQQPRSDTPHPNIV